MTPEERSPVEQPIQRVYQVLEVSDLDELELASLDYPQSRLQSALRVVRGILASRPTDLAALVAQVRLLRALGSADEAESALDRAFTQHPGDTNLCNELGCIRFECGQFQRALDAFDRALASRWHADAALGATAALIELGRYADASTLVERVSGELRGVAPRAKGIAGYRSPTL